MLVGQMASSVAVVSVISAENSSIDWATRMAATRRLWCTIQGVPRAREPQRGQPSRTLVQGQVLHRSRDRHRWMGDLRSARGIGTMVSEKLIKGRQKI